MRLRTCLNPSQQGFEENEQCKILISSLAWRNGLVDPIAEGSDAIENSVGQRAGAVVRMQIGNEHSNQQLLISDRHDQRSAIVKLRKRARFISCKIRLFDTHKNTSQGPTKPVDSTHTLLG